MLNFAEQTGSGAVKLVWSFLYIDDLTIYIKPLLANATITRQAHTRSIVHRSAWTARTHAPPSCTRDKRRRHDIDNGRIFFCGGILVATQKHTLAKCHYVLLLILAVCQPKSFLKWGGFYYSKLNVHVTMLRVAVTSAAGTTTTTPISYVPSTTSKRILPLLRHATLVVGGSERYLSSSTIEMAQRRIIRSAASTTIDGVRLRNRPQWNDIGRPSSSYFARSYYGGVVRGFSITTPCHTTFQNDNDDCRRRQHPLSQHRLLSSQAVAQPAAATPIQNDEDNDSNNIDEDAIAKSRRDHDRRVAEVQAKLVRRKQDELQQQQRKLQEEQQEKQLLEKEEQEVNKQFWTKEQRQRRKQVIQSIRIWLAKEPKYYESTMEALKQSSGFALKRHGGGELEGGSSATTTSFNNSGGGSSSSNLQQSYLSGQVKALYVDTIGSFVNEIHKNPTPKIQNVLQQLDDVGFGDVEWSKKYRMTRSYYVQKRELDDAINLNYYRMKRNQSILESIQMEVEELQKQHQRLNNNRDDNTSDDDLQKSALQKLIEQKEYTIKKREKQIEAMTTKHYKLDRKVTKLKSNYPPLLPDQFRTAERIVESVVREDICQELAAHIQQRHQKLLDQYQLLDNITGTVLVW